MKRWVQYNMPVFACLESSDTVGHEEITRVVVGDDELEDVHLAGDAFGDFLLYDVSCPVRYSERGTAQFGRSTISPVAG